MVFTHKMAFGPEPQLELLPTLEKMHCNFMGSVHCTVPVPTIVVSKDQWVELEQGGGLVCCKIYVISGVATQILNSILHTSNKHKIRKLGL